MRKYAHISHSFKLFIVWNMSLFSHHFSNFHQVQSLKKTDILAYFRINYFSTFYQVQSLKKSEIRSYLRLFKLWSWQNCEKRWWESTALFHTFSGSRLGEIVKKGVMRNTSILHLHPDSRHDEHLKNGGEKTRPYFTLNHHRITNTY